MYPIIINTLELPATHVPLGLNKEGLPIGIQVFMKSLMYLYYYKILSLRLKYIIISELGKLLYSWKSKMFGEC